LHTISRRRPLTASNTVSTCTRKRHISASPRPTTSRSLQRSCLISSTSRIREDSTIGDSGLS
jgi:hypothetical protein